MSDSYLLSGGRILTGARTVDCLLIEDGRVIAAGARSHVAREAPTGAERVRLNDRIVLPGLIDAHLHLAELTRAREGLSMRGARSLKELVDRLAEWASTHPRGLLSGSGWSVEQFAELREPTARDLDRAVADRPVVLYHASGHAAVANRVALEESGFSERTPDPPGGRLGRNPDGSLNGLIYETALQPVRHLTTAASPLEPAAIGRTVRLANSQGVTAVGTMSTGPDELQAIRTWFEMGSPTLRVRCYARAAQRHEFPPRDWLPPGPEGYLALVGVKAFVDGAFGPRTAWLEEPYSDLPSDSGVPVLRETDLIELFAECARERRQPAVHAIGDRGLSEVVHALERLGSGAPAWPRIEHASLVPPSVVSRLERVHPALVVQPGFVWSDTWLLERLGPSRVRWAYPFRTLTDRGHRLAGSTDAPYDPPDPWRGLSAAVSRSPPGGGSANPTPDEALSPDQALALFTGNAGRALREPDLGSLEPGARADLVLVEARDLAGAIGAGAAAVRETWVAGRRVFELGGSRDPTTV